MNATEITVEEILRKGDIHNVAWSNGAITDICINYVDGEESEQFHIVADGNGGMQILDTKGEPVWTFDQVVRGENLDLERKTETDFENDITNE